MIWLDEQIHAFPSPLLANEDDDIIAIGGDLDPKRLLLAYSLGLFPWYNEGETPILWQSPNPRFVLFPDHLIINRSLRRSLNKKKFEIKFDTAFREVLNKCAEVKRNDQDGTWLNESLQASLFDLHQLGYAHSAEAWYQGRLVGGLYGIALGGVFYGESMFSEMSDASKVAFVSLVQKLSATGYKLIDCQSHTNHLARFGAVELPRTSFHHLLREYLKHSPKQQWSN